MKSPTFLVDSSLVTTAIGNSTPDHITEFNRVVSGGKLVITVYVRMEFIRRRVCDLVRLALIADQCDTLPRFWHYYEQGFEKGRLKTGIFALGAGGNNLRQAMTTKALAEEFATLAVNILKMVDRRLPQSGNRAQCQIGAKKLVVDYNDLLHDVGQFVIDFSRNIEDCGVNDFLRFGSVHSGSNVLISDEASSKTDVITELKSLRDSNTWVTCHVCKKIGDAVIAIEQPQRAKLVHGDNKTFPKFCAALGKKEIYVRSVQAIEHEKPDFIFKLGGKLPDEMT